MKHQIIQAAVQEIAHRGLKFSIRDLAGRLGISTKTLYQHFASKEIMIQYLVEQSVTDMKEKELSLLENRSLSLQEKLREMLIVIPQAFTFTDMRVLEELRKMYPGQWAILDEYLNQGWDNIRLLFQEGIARGEFRQFDSELFIQTYVGGVYQIMHNSRFGGKGLQEALTGVVDLLLTGIYNLGERRDQEEGNK